MPELEKITWNSHIAKISAKANNCKLNLIFKKTKFYLSKLL